MHSVYQVNHAHRSRSTSTLHLMMAFSRENGDLTSLFHKKNAHAAEVHKPRLFFYRISARIPKERLFSQNVRVIHTPHLLLQIDSTDILNVKNYIWHRVLWWSAPRNLSYRTLGNIKISFLRLSFCFLHICIFWWSLSLFRCCGQPLWHHLSERQALVPLLRLLSLFFSICMELQMCRCTERPCAV